MKNINELENNIKKLADNKKVLFIATKNVDYIRNSQEIELLKASAHSVQVVGYKDKSYILRLFKIYIKLLMISVKNYNVIFVGFAPQLILPLFYYKFRKKIIIEDFFISMYDTLVNDRKKFRSSGVIAKMLCCVDKITIKRADHIIADTYAHGSYFIDEFGTERDKINVLYLKADTSIYYPRSIYKSDEIHDKFVVLYFGSILPLQGVDIILECVEKMQDISSVVFEIIGPLDKEDIKKYSQLKNVIFTPWLSQQCLAEKIAVADLCLAGHFNSKIKKASRTIPGKAYIYDAMDKSMILGNNLANKELFVEDDLKYFYVEMGDSDKLMEKIIYVMGKKLRTDK